MIIKIQFRCGHWEAFTTKQIKREQVQHDATFVVNGQVRAASGQYCRDCSKPQPVRLPDSFEVSAGRVNRGGCH